MITLLASLVLAQFTAPLEADEPQRIEGRCTYPPALVEEADTAILVQCGEVTLSSTAIAFAARGFDPSVAFVGQWQGDQFAVERVARRGIEDADEARGFCRMQLRDNDLTAIVCSVIASPRSYVVNFLIPRI